MLEVVPGQSVYVGGGDGGVASVAQVPVAQVIGQEEDNVWGPGGQGEQGEEEAQEEGRYAGDWRADCQQDGSHAGD